MVKKSCRIRFLASFTCCALIALTLLVIGCGAGKATVTPSDPSAPQDIGALKGSITIDGSSTVFPITEAVAEDFGNLTRRRVRITVGVSGTGGGFAKFCDEETNITNASRPIKPIEVESCKENGVEYIELPVAIDGVTVMVHPDNDFVQCVTIPELKFIWSPDAEDEITRWNQVRPTWPDRSMRLYGPGVDSGTFDYFTGVVIGEVQASRGDFTSSENDNVLVQGISGDKNSLGFFGFAFFAENTDRLKALGIDAGNGCVTPTRETINQGTYHPLARPLFIYVTKAAADQIHIKEFVRYYLSPKGRGLAEEVGYVAYPARVSDLALNRFDKGLTGTIFGGSSPQPGSVEEVLAANQ